VIPRREHGQATVELALALPVLCVLLLAIVQLTTVVADLLAVHLAAREAARAAAVAADPASAARDAAARSTSLPLEVTTILDGAFVTTVVHASSPTDVPLIGWAVPDAGIHARVTMQREPP
jgi:hypothetical protein